MTLLTQVQVEQQMYHGGIKRAVAMMENAEEGGSAHRNPYSKDVFREFVLPISRAITEACAPTAGSGRRAAHVALLKNLDHDAVAYLAVRYALNICMTPSIQANERTVAFAIGKAVNSELVLTQLAAENPELYHTLANDLQRRLSKDERHKMTVFKMQATKAGIEWTEWPLGAREQVGSFLLGLLLEAGMLVMPDLVVTRNLKKVARQVGISLHVMERLDKIKGFVAISSPTYGPCVEVPRRWESAVGGGFYTEELQRTLPMLVRCHPSARPRIRESAMPTVLAAANALQQTAWKVNTALLAVVRGLSQAGVATKEIVTLEGTPKPAPPAWLVARQTKEGTTEAEQAEFKQWKFQVAAWYTANKLLGVKYGRFYSATRAADMFAEYPALYFVHFADSRGRFYPMTYGVNPQGSDLQKALLHFARGLPVSTPDAIRWFHIQGANKFGFDKATLSERFMWAHERREWLLHIAADPINHREWLDAGDPLQFLAWVLEYAEFVANPDTFVSHLPVSMDGSCNGLQNLSALLRDEVGGKATNLTPNVVMEDIYRLVSEAATSRMQTPISDPVLDTLRLKWLEHGINRSVVKRSVMTTPYGVTVRSATGYVISDYLKDPSVQHPFAKEELYQAAGLLMRFVWPAIGDIVVKGRLCMEWLKRGARAIAKTFPPEAEPVVEWETPSGFPASQAYFEVEEHRINTKLVGTETIRLVVGAEGESPDTLRHASGLAPNFVHSMDAAHLHRVAAACLREGIDSIAMIHDDYGTHAANAQTLYRLIREEFVSMYEDNDPVQDFFSKYPEVGEPPAKGSLDIRGVLDSPFFFS